MVEIIPTILVNNFDEVKERIKAVEKYVNWVQLDVMDGVFVNNETWPHSVIPGIAKRGKPFLKELEKLKKLKNKVKIEAHLMVERPEEEFDEWLKIADRIIVHFESKITNRELGIRELIKKAHKKKKGIGLALNPETHYAVAMPFLKDLDLVLFMTVQPGWGGQELKGWVLNKIEFLRNKWPKGNIEVDGGINDENIKRIFKSGANLICAGTYIYRGKDIRQAIKNLKKYV
ncbi:MAG: ribulose-phosphate 3-epimerase [Patescibacteria group bacterium]